MVTEVTPKNSSSIKKRIMAPNNSNIIQSSNIYQIRDFKDLGSNNIVAPFRKSELLEQQLSQENYYISPNTRSMAFKKNEFQ